MRGGDRLRSAEARPAEAGRARWFALGVLGACQAASACATCSPDLGGVAVIPGLAIVKPEAAMALPLLCAAIKRPFILSPVRTPHSLLYSIQANVLSTALIAAGSGSLVWAGKHFRSDLAADLLGLWVLGAVFVSALIEWAWIRSRAPVAGPSPSYARHLLANVVAAAVVGSLAFWRVAFGTDSNAYYEAVAGVRPGVIAVAATALLLVYVAAFARTPRLARLGADAASRFEVLGRAEAASPDPAATGDGRPPSQPSNS